MPSALIAGAALVGRALLAPALARAGIRTRLRRVLLRAVGEESPRAPSIVADQRQGMAIEAVATAL
ncbi:MAG: hypothetical protein K2Y56_05040 [Methylobacterium sp.]|uniref:hypothetical protein n=1 Tax=Methylobacterium sp. TaxID=409 RepID=UPI0025E6EB7F|nr:hypothetical protein [Methylobacterium sp.]MBX9930890.1 hypothetical protein [Methylobacterium sp.]